MELVTKYLEVYEPYINEADYVLCEERFYNTSKYTRLKMKVKPGSIVAYRNSIRLLPGRDFTEQHNKQGSYFIMIGEDENTLNGDLILTSYLGYTLEGDTSWN